YRVIHVNHPGSVVARLLDPSQIGLVDITGDIPAIEYRAVEVGDLRIAFAHRVDQVFQVLIDQPVCTNQFGHLVAAAVVGDQLLRRRHVDAVDVGIAHLGGSGTEVHLPGSGITGHLDDFPASGTAHDGIVHQQDILAAELQLDGVELLAHRLLAGGLAGHDEGAADIAILDEALAELHPQPVGQFHRRGAAGVRYRNHHVDAVVGPLPEDLLRQLLAHAQPRLVHQDTVDDRI